MKAPGHFTHGCSRQLIVRRYECSGRAEAGFLELRTASIKSAGDVRRIIAIKFKVIMLPAMVNDAVFGRLSRRF